MSLTLKELREKLGAKQDELGKVFAEAKGDDGQYHFENVTCLGSGVKGSIAVAEKVKAMNSELDELAGQAETLEAAEQAAGDHAGRQKSRGGFTMPGGGEVKGRGNYPDTGARFKSLGEMVSEHKSYGDWAKSGAAGPLNLNFEDYLPSEMLSRAAQFETLGTKALMTTAAGYAPEALRLPGFIEMATRPIQMLDIIPVSKCNADQVPYMEETTRVHAAANAAEGGAYGESAFAFTERTSPVRKITDSVPVTDEQLEDAAMVESYINGRLTFGLRQRLDSQCLIGDAVGSNLRGLKNVVGIQTQAKGVDPVPDAFFKAMTKIRLGGRAIPTHHVMHPTDWEKIRLLRTADGVYIWGNPSEAGSDRLWGLPVVQQDADAAGTGYTGSFQPSWLTLFERRGIDIQMGFVGNQFLEGKRTVRGDMRVALVFTRPAAFCSVTGIV